MSLDSTVVPPVLHLFALLTAGRFALGGGNAGGVGNLVPSGDGFPDAATPRRLAARRAGDREGGHALPRAAASAEK